MENRAQAATSRLQTTGTGQWAVKRAQEGLLAVKVPNRWCPVSVACPHSPPQGLPLQNGQGVTCIPKATASWGRRSWDGGKGSPGYRGS